jgi:hypothetical protein
VCLSFYNRRSGGYLSLSFYIQIFKQRVSIIFQCALGFVIKKKIVLVRHVCSRLPIIIRSHNLHARDIRRTMSEIVSYHEKD